MHPDKLRELRELVRLLSHRSLCPIVGGYDSPCDCARGKALALLDAELALHSTAEIAGTRAGCSTCEAMQHDDEWDLMQLKVCPECGKRVEVSDAQG